MAFQRGTFCGSTLRSLTSSIGWGVGQPSQMTVSLVDDPANGDAFFPAQPGSPAFFSYGNTNFFGIFQKYERKIGIDGNPVFDVTLVDPREILEGVQVIIGAYRGPVGIPNLINAFGYWENYQFGYSGSNEAGMPWNKIWGALEAICNSAGGGQFGGPLVLNGVRYGIDLSMLPFPSASYRLGGTSISLMDAIAQICEDGGCDFFVRLVGYTIQVVTVSRRTQPILGTIQRIIDNSVGTNTVVRASNGLEFRNEVTSSFIVGGPQTTLFETDTTAIKPFWGYDANGSAIWSNPGVLQLMGYDGEPVTSFTTEYMLLNGSPVADIIASDQYKCTTFEMLCAKGNYDTWSTYIQNNRPDLAKAGKIASVFKAPDTTLLKKLTMSDITDIDAEMASLVADDSLNNAMRLYEFVKGYADEYLGKKFAISLPFVMWYQEDETFRLISSYNVVDSGYLAENSQPLGLSRENEDQFRNPDGRFRCFVRFPSVQDVDLTNIPPQNSVIDSNGLFVEASADSQILFEDKPYAIVTLPGVLTQLPVESSGSPTLLNGILGIGDATDIQMPNQEFVQLKISPDVIYPDAAGIPLQSNLYTYGPWGASGVPGKVLFEQDSGLTPWDYGDFQTMNNAGSSRVTNAITNMQLSETGILEMAGLPIVSLGDVLVSGGPNVTNIDVQISPQGVTTSYRFQTYTPRYGVFNKGVGERLKRLGLSGQALRRSARVAEKNLAAKMATNSMIANTGGKQFRQNAPNWSTKQTPHTLMVAYNFNDEDSDGDSITRGTMQSATHADALTLSNPGSGTDFQNTAIMALNGLFRPFSTKIGPCYDGGSSSGNPDGGSGSPAGSGELISHFEEQASYDNPYTFPCLKTLGPLVTNHDIETFTYGDKFESLNGFRNEPDNENARLFSLRGPVVITGWGFGWDLKKYPSDDGGENYVNKFGRNQQRWKTGPLDVLWDNNRKVWTCHDIITGVTGEQIPAGGSGRFAAKGWEVYVNNYFSQGVSGYVKAICGYAVLDNAWYIIAADCPNSDSGSG